MENDIRTKLLSSLLVKQDRGRSMYEKVKSEDDIRYG